MGVTRHVVMFSGGVGSWAAAKRVAAQHGADRLTLLFCDTRIEDADLYRFIGEAAANIGAPLVTIADGRTPWDVFRDERILSQRFDPCSKFLKRRQADAWLDANCDPAATVVYVGIDWSESHRFERLAARRGTDGWRYAAPLCDAPYLTKDDVFAWLAAEGVRRPRLYDLGFAHNNCGGGCIKAGAGHFTHLLRTLPDVYAEWERNEAALRAELGEGAYILRDRTGGVTRPLTLTQLRRRVEAGHEPDLFDIGGCGCFADAGAAA